MKTRVAMLVMALVIGVGTAQAGWIATNAGTYDYTNTANWAGGVVDGNFNNALAVDVWVNFPADTTLATGWNFLQTTDKTLYWRSANGAQTVTLGGDISAVSSNSGTVNYHPWIFGRNSGGHETFNLNLGGNRTIALKGGYFSSYPDLVMGAKVVDTSTSNYSLRVTGTMDFQFTQSNSFTGPFVAENFGGYSLGVRVGDRGILSTTNLTFRNSGLVIDNWMRYDGNDGIMRTNRIADTATVRLENSPLSLYGGTRYTVFTNTLTEKIGPLYLDGGYNRIVVQYGYTNGYPGSPIYGITNSGHVRLTCDALYRSNGAVASFWGGDRNGNFDQTDLGRSGTSASSVTVLDTSNFGAINGLLPWATVGQPNRSTAENRFTRFCKYDATDGFQPFNEGVDDQLGFGGATGTTNVRLAAGTTVSSDVTVNSLSLRYPTSISTFTLDRDVAGRTITLNSGAFLVAPTGNVNNLTINVNPDLNFAGQHAYIHNMSAGAGALAVYGTFKNIGADGITLSSYNNGYVMFGVSQTWTCPTYCVNGGVKFHGNDVGPTNTAFRVSKGAWLVFNQDSSVYIKSLSGDGPLYGKMSGWNDFGASSFFYIGDASDATFNGNIYSGESLPTQSGNLTKQGAGTWTVNGSSYLTNTTTVAAGTLVVNGSFALNSSMTVSNGATLGGTGTVAVLTVAAGGTLAPGAAASNAIGTLAVSGAMTLSSNTTCRVEIQNAGGTAGRGWDLVSATGALTLTATSANKATIKVVSLGANGQPGAATNWTGVQSWKIISASSVSGFVPNSFTVDTSALSGVDIALGVSDTGPAGTGLYLVKLTRGTVLSTY